MPSPVVIAPLLLRALVSPWEAPCAPPTAPGAVPECGIPRAIPGQPPTELAVRLRAVTQPGEAAAARAEGPGHRLVATSVYPATASGTPPYLQIRFETGGPSPVLCALSARWRMPNMESPPLICASAPDARGVRRGWTLVFRFEP